MRIIYDDKLYLGQFGTSTPATLTKNYITRVTADLGKVINPELVLKAFEAITLLTSYLGRTPSWISWCDACFGVKYDNVGNVIKVYDLLNLNDFVPSGSSPILIKDNKYYAFLFNGTTQGLASQNSITWGTDKATCIYTRRLIAGYIDTDRFITSSDIASSSAGVKWTLGNSPGAEVASISDSGIKTNKVGTISIAKEIHAATFDVSQTSPNTIKWYKNNIEQTTINSAISTSGNFSTNKIFIMNSPTTNVNTPGYIYNWIILKEVLPIEYHKILTNLYNTQGGQY